VKLILHHLVKFNNAKDVNLDKLKTSVQIPFVDAIVNQLSCSVMLNTNRICLN